MKVGIMITAAPGICLADLVFSVDSKGNINVTSTGTPSKILVLAHEFSKRIFELYETKVTGDE